MEWVETTGRSIEEAKERALDELGVDESEAEFEVVEDARSGLFGRLRSEARVRARVRPTAPRSKEDRRDRRRRNRGGDREAAGTAAASGHSASATSASGTSASGTSAAGTSAAGTSAAGTSASGEVASANTAAAARVPDGAAEMAGSPAGDGSGASVATVQGRAPERAQERNRSGRNRPSARRVDSGRAAERNGNQQGEGSDVEVALEEQGRLAQEFLSRLTAEFGLDAEVTIERPDEDTVDLQLRGSGLGLLIGQKGATLLAIQDLTRTVVHHQTGAGNGRIHVDVGGYRQKRAEALSRFAQQVASTVKQTGARTVLEPMTAADRKVVHDAITDIDGVSTISEGEEPRRRVVVIPADS